MLGFLYPTTVIAGVQSLFSSSMTTERFFELIGPRTLFLEGKVAQVNSGLTSAMRLEPGETSDQARARIVTPLVSAMISAKNNLTEVTSSYQALRPSLQGASLTRGNAAMTRARAVLSQEATLEGRWTAHRASAYDRTNLPWTYQAERTVGAVVKEASAQAERLTEATRRRIDPASEGPGLPPPVLPPEDDGEGLNTTLLIVGAASVLILGGGLAFGLMSRKKAAMQRGVKNPKSRLRRKLRAHHRALLKR